MSMGELNKIAGALLGALLLFLLLNFFSGKIFEGDHHDDVLAYALEIEGAEDAETEAEEEVAVDLASLVQTADASNGEGVFRQCSACHKIEDGKNGVGPHLWGVVGRPIAAVDGYAYSGTLESMGGEWGLEELSGFLENPKAWAPGTKMGYGGLADDQDRVDLIAYLNVEGGSDIDLSAGLEAPAAETETAAVEATTDAEPAEATEEGATEEAAAEEATTEEAATEEAATDEAASGEAVTEEEAATEATEPEEASTEDAAAEEAPAEEAPAEEAPAEEATTEEAAAEEAPAEEGATEEAPTEEAAAEEAPVEEAASEEATSEEAAAEEAPGEEAPTEEAAAEEPATEEAASEEASTEEAPAATKVTEAEATEAEAAEAAAAPEGDAAEIEVAAADPAPAEEAAETEAASTEEAAEEAPEAVEVAAAPAADSIFSKVSVDAGAKLFRQCKACHVVEDGKNRVGPHLYGVVGRPVAAVDGFKYSGPMASYGGEWTPERLDAFLANPRGVVKGTKMAYPGLKKEEDRAAVIKYLNEQSDNPLALN
ncbi:MAG: cytochrome c family protein [Pseudomonadota bacterium]